MDKIILKEYSKEDVKKRLVHFSIEEDEQFVINEIKKPTKFLFLKFKGEYEIIIIKKKNKKVNNNKKNNIQPKKENKIKENCEVKECRLESIAKEHFKRSNLKINVVKKLVTDTKIIFLVDGEDARNFKDRKGFLNLSKLMSISTPKLKKRIEFSIYGQNDKSKMEEEVRKLARETAKKVIETKKEKKLYGLSASKRRIVHDELSHINSVKTKSYGEDNNRFLKVSYVEG